MAAGQPCVLYNTISTNMDVSLIGLRKELSRIWFAIESNRPKPWEYKHNDPRHVPFNKRFEYSLGRGK